MEEEVLAKLRRLTRRELQVVYWRCQGYRWKDVAKKLVIAETTVFFYEPHIVEKLELKGRTPSERFEELRAVYSKALFERIKDPETDFERLFEPNQEPKPPIGESQEQTGGRSGVAEQELVHERDAPVDGPQVPLPERPPEATSQPPGEKPEEEVSEVEPPTEPPAKPAQQQQDQQVAEADLPLVPLPPPDISFIVDRDAIRPGDPAVLSWAVANAQEVLLDGVRVEHQGSITIWPLETTTYRLSGTGLNNDIFIVHKTIKVQLRELEVPEHRRWPWALVFAVGGIVLLFMLVGILAPPPPTTPTMAVVIAPASPTAEKPSSTPATATSSAPTPTSPPPTRTPVPATAAAPKPPDPRGSIAYHVNDNGVDRIDVVSLDRDAVGPLVEIGPVLDIILGAHAHLAEWSPDSNKFAYIFSSSSSAGNSLRVLDFRTSTTQSLFSGEPGGGLSSPTWSPDGTKIAFIRMRGNQTSWAIDVVNADGSRQMDLRTNTQGEQYRGGISWGRQGILTLAQNTGTNPSDVYTMFADGGGLTNLSRNPTAEDTTPAWSPDGKLIAFTSNRDGPQRIYVMNADGSGVRRVSQGNFNDASPAWSPDGNWIAFASFRGGSTDVHIMDVNGGNVRRITSRGGDHPVWSR